MSGHSKWHQIKHKKALSDAKKGELFGKLSRLITLAASSGADPEENPRLRDAVAKARSSGMGQETILRAIARSSLPTAERELAAVTYEAYGPGGAAILIEAVTDNPNRTNHELREIMGRFDAKLVAPGVVRWMFERKVVVGVPLPEERSAEERELALIDAGADGVWREANRIVAVVNPETAPAFRQALDAAGIPLLGASYELIPRERMTLGANHQNVLGELLGALDGHPDVQDIYTNANLPAEG